MWVIQYRYLAHKMPTWSKWENQFLKNLLKGCSKNLLFNSQLLKRCHPKSLPPHPPHHKRHEKLNTQFTNWTKSLNAWNQKCILLYAVHQKRERISCGRLAVWIEHLTPICVLWVWIHVGVSPLCLRKFGTGLHPQSRDPWLGWGIYKPCNPSVWEAELSHWRCMCTLPAVGPRCTLEWEAACGGVCV